MNGPLEYPLHLCRWGFSRLTDVADLYRRAQRLRRPSPNVSQGDVSVGMNDGLALTSMDAAESAHHARAVMMRVVIRAVESIMTDAPRTDTIVSPDGRLRTRWVVSDLPDLVCSIVSLNSLNFAMAMQLPFILRPSRAFTCIHPSTY